MYLEGAGGIRCLIVLVARVRPTEQGYKIENGFLFNKPVSRFGWTFFKLWLKPNLHSKIDEHFSDMIKKTKGRKQNEKFCNFMSDFFLSKGCSVKLKLIEEY